MSQGPGGSMSQVVGVPNNSYKHITNTAWLRARLCKLQKWCTRLAAASDKACQLLAHDRWFSPGTPASSTTKTGRHDIAEILLKEALNPKNKSWVCCHRRTFYSHGSNSGLGATQLHYSTPIYPHPKQHTNILFCIELQLTLSTQ